MLCIWWSHQPTMSAFTVNRTFGEKHFEQKFFLFITYIYQMGITGSWKSPVLFNRGTVSVVSCWNVYTQYYKIKSSLVRIGGCRGRIVPVQSVSIITKVVSFNPAHGEVHLIQHYVIKFVSDLLQFGGFLQVLWVPPRYNWNIVESGIKHPTLLQQLSYPIVDYCLYLPLHNNSTSLFMFI